MGRPSPGTSASAGSRESRGAAAHAGARPDPVDQHVRRHQEPDRAPRPRRTAPERDGVAAENVLARLRSVLVIEISDKDVRLLLACGNKPENSVGYATSKRPRRRPRPDQGHPDDAAP
ncbi:MAG: hypothetical protein AB7I08_02270 [Thermoleophilia bacterium]